MTITVRVATPEDLPAMAAADARAFAHPFDPEAVEAKTALIDPSRFVVAVDGDEIVGINGSFALEMTLPGGATIPVGGVTWVSVAATHRRQGILRRTMAAVHDDIAARGEPASVLSASERGIYARFGYGIATVHWTWTIDARAAVIRPELVVPPGSVRYLVGDRVREHVVGVYERYRRTCPGEMARDSAWWDVLWKIWTKPTGEATESHFLCHADGYLRYRATHHWQIERAMNKVEVLEFVALTPAARVALWQAVLGIDLTGTVEGSSVVPFGDVFPELLTDPRLVRTTSAADGLWVRVTDPATAFSARTYGTADAVVVEVSGTRWRIEGDAAGGTCARTRVRADVVTDSGGLGSLLLGGVRLQRMIDERRATARDAAVARRADRFFLGDVTPNLQTAF